MREEEWQTEKSNNLELVFRSSLFRQQVSVVTVWMIFWEYGNRQSDHKWLTDLVVLSNTSSSTGSKRSSY